MTREEYEEIGNAYEMAYQDYSSVMRKSVPESWRVEAAVKDLEELRLLMKQYEDEHPEECPGQGGNDQSERADQPVQDDPSPAGESKDDILPDEAFLNELEAMDGPDDVPCSSIPDPAAVNAGRYATVTFCRVNKNSSVVVKMIATVEAATVEEAVEKAMAEIKGVFPADTLWPEDGSGWYWDDEDEAEVDWED